MAIDQTVNLQGPVLFIAAAFGASAAFINPLGYQTNLMVVGPGGYSIKDFIKVGLPLSLIYAMICIASLSIWYL
jgi:di/tricarboxylate transporter